MSDPEAADDGEHEFISLLQEVNHDQPKRGGLAWRNLRVCSVAGPSRLTLWTTSDYLWYPFRMLYTQRTRQQKTILNGLEGLIEPSELLLVLGIPGSGCSTLLRTLSGQTKGLNISSTSELRFANAQSTSTGSDEAFCAYQAEQDEHLPYLSARDTVSFATCSRLGISPGGHHSLQATQTLLRALGLSTVSSTCVGNDFTHGLSGGERRRISIAELLINNHQFQAWDNSSRGLDISSAKKMIKTLRTMARTTGLSLAINLYQVSDELFKLFDKVVVLQGGQQIYFGEASDAISYFTRQGLTYKPNTPIADYLTSLTVNNHNSGVEKGLVQAWQDSDERANLMLGIMSMMQRIPIMPSAWARRSRYGLHPGREIGLCLRRALQCLRANSAPSISSLVGNCIMSFILGSLFLNLQEDTTSFYGRSVLLFFISLLNTFLGAFEGVALWGIRPIVEKQRQYGLCRPVDEAIASMLADLPNKILLTLVLNTPMYFLANLHRTAAAFLVFYLFTFVSLLTGSMMFRAIGAFSKTLNQSIAPGAIFATLNLIFTGFVLPIPYMPVWLGWFRWINPIAYAFESLIINEFSGRSFTCTSYIPSGPSYNNIGPLERQCTVVGAQIGASVVEGTSYIAATFDYRVEHLWRNLGAILGLMTLFCVLYLLGTHLVRAHQICGEVPVYLSATTRKHSSPEDTLTSSPTRLGLESFNDTNKTGPTHVEEETSSRDTEDLLSANGNAALVWNTLSLSISDKKTTRLLLDNVEGYVTSGSLMALMGPSGAGKTSLLNCLADRCSYGRMTGTKFVLAEDQDDIVLSEVLGYAQQQDIHLASSTVYEALVFSAMLRQPAQYSKPEKLEWVDKVVDDLGIADMIHQVVGIPGRGLNIEQRKQLTIAVELAARPKILLLDEPFSGLDSDTAWSICKLLQRLSRRGYAILCTIHQPSARLFEMFDRLLYLRDGKTIYCGTIGPQSRDMINYFEKHDARPCQRGENPAEWMFDVTAAPAQAQITKEWHTRWSQSSTRSAITIRTTQMTEQRHSAVLSSTANSDKNLTSDSWTQFVLVCRRNFLHDWRTPSYLWCKFFLVGGLALLNGLSFLKAPNTLQGIQNQIFSVFIVMTTFSNMSQIIMPQFVTNRTLFERREQPSRTYSWWVFITSNIITELPMQAFLAVILFVAWYYPVGFFGNASSTGDLITRGWIVLLTLISYMLWSSTFAQMIVTIMPDAATGINIANLLDSLALIFSGVLVPAKAMPKFWIFMYRVSPATYFISSIISAAIGGDDVPIQCATNELVIFNPPSGQTCGQYLADYIQFAGAALINPLANNACQVCPAQNTSQVLATIGINADNRWRDLGLTFCYTVFNILAALMLYWLCRVPKTLSGSKISSG